MRGFRFRSSLKNDPRVFSLFCFLLFLCFFKLTPVFSHRRHPTKAPRRTREKTSGTQGKSCFKADIFLNGRCYPLSCILLVLLF